MDICMLLKVVRRDVSLTLLWRLQLLHMYPYLIAGYSSSYYFVVRVYAKSLTVYMFSNYVGITIGALILDAQPRNMLKGHLMTQNWLLQLMRDDMTMICHHHELLLQM